MDELDRMLASYAGIRFPFDKRWKRLAAEFCAERLERIREFRALGLQAVLDPHRKKLISRYLGPMNGHDVEEYNFNIWVLDEAMGERNFSEELIFFRCMGCNKIRTSANLAKGPCKCGSRRMNDSVGPLETGRIIGMLALGY